MRLFDAVPHDADEAAVVDAEISCLRGVHKPICVEVLLNHPGEPECFAYECATCGRPLYDIGEDAS